MLDPQFETYGKGYFLIANPVLPDPNFSRTVVLLCDHNDQGSFGLVINRTTEMTVSEVFNQGENLKCKDNRVYLGGPVSQSQVFYLCRSQEPIPHLEHIVEGVYLGMNWMALEDTIDQLPDPENNIRFYLGYSGWAAGQLAGEMERRSWLTCAASDEQVFGSPESAIWPDVVRSLGKEYEYLINAPENPQWN